MYERYCAIRDAHGLKDIDVSRATGIIQSTFSDWKKGKSSPKIDKLQKLAEYFQVPLAYFLAEDDEEEQRILNMAMDMVHEKAQEEKMQKLNHLLENPKVVAFAEMISRLSDEDVNKVFEYAKLLQIAENSEGNK